MSSVPVVLVAGDSGRGPSLIVWATAEGRSAAAVKRYRMGETELPAPITGLAEEGAQPHLNLGRRDDDALAALAALAALESASVRYRIAVGTIARRKTLRLQASGAFGVRVESVKLRSALRDGFSLNASVACRAGERMQLERLHRYVARPPLAFERLSRNGDVQRVGFPHVRAGWTIRPPWIP